MIKATVKTNETIETKFFDTIGQAIKWVREFAFEAISWKVFDQYGIVYYSC